MSVHVPGSGDVSARGAAAGMGRGHLSRGSVPALGEALVPRCAGGQHHRALPVSIALYRTGCIHHSKAPIHTEIIIFCALSGQISVLTG